MVVFFYLNFNQIREIRTKKALTIPKAKERELVLVIVSLVEVTALEIEVVKVAFAAGN